MRDYSVMRQVLARLAGARRTLSLGDFADVQPSGDVPSEMDRLVRDGLVEGEVLFDPYGTCVKFRASELTDEGKELLNEGRESDPRSRKTQCLFAGTKGLRT